MRKLFAVLALLAALPVCAIALARANLPDTGCAVTQAQIDTLELEKMNYADVAGVFGCEGELAKREDLGSLRIETYRWRGDAWPYGVFAGHFYNGVMHGTDVRSLSVNLSWPPAGAEAGVETGAVSPQGGKG